jgi:hypothetical protein
LNGLIVLEPYATQIINGEKELEFRDKKPPVHNRNIPIYLLSGGFILGKIKIFGFGIRHNPGSKYYWRIKVLSKYKTKRKYKHPNGAQIWVKDVGTRKVQTRLD